MASPRDILKNIFDLRPEEAGPLISILFLSFTKGAAAVLFDTAANTHFVKIYGSSSLPKVYLAASVASLLVGAIYSAFASRIATRPMLVGTLTAALISILFIYAGFIWFPEAHWLALLAMTWKEALFILTNIVLWATAGYLFDLRQGKRLFGLVAAGGITAGIIGGLIIPWLVEFWGLSQLFLLSAIAMGAAIFCLSYVTHRFPKNFAVAPEETNRLRPAQIKKPWWQLFRNRYLALFLMLSILSNFGFFFADYVYFNRVGTAFHQETELATFFGRFSAILGTVQLVTSLFLAGPIITRYGLGFALMALPVLNGFGMAAASGVSFWMGLGNTFFWMIILIKLCDEALRASLLAPAFRILYQPLPAQDRLAFQAKTESIIEPIGVGLVGAVLLVLTTVFKVSLPVLCLILVVILTIWIAVAELLRHEYTTMLTRALSQRRLGGASVILEDGSSSTIFLQGTQSANPGEVIYCLTMLEEMGHPEWEQKLKNSLTHADCQVREYGLKHVETKALKALKEMVRDLWQHDPAPTVRRAALQAYCALGEESILEEVSVLLTSSDEAWRMGSIVGLLRYGGIEGVLTAGTRLQTMTHSAQEEDRKKAAEILGEIGMTNFYSPLLHLLNDVSHEVRRSALRATGKLKNTKLIPNVLLNLSHRDLRPNAINALRQYGQSIVPVLKTSLEEEPSLHIRRSLVRTLGSVGGNDAIQALLWQLNCRNKALRRQVLSSLTALHYEAPPEVLTSVAKVITELANSAARTILIQASFTKSGRWPLLCQALAAEIHDDRDQLLWLLAFFPGSQPLRRVSKELRTGSNTQRARAIELLENLIPPEFKSTIIPLLDDLALDQQAERLKVVFRTPEMTEENQLVILANLSHEYIFRWTKACALYEVGRNQIREGTPAVQKSLTEKEPILRQTAEWAAKQFNPEINLC